MKETAPLRPIADHTMINIQLKLMKIRLYSLWEFQVFKLFNFVLFVYPMLRILTTYESGSGTGDLNTGSDFFPRIRIRLSRKVGIKFDIIIHHFMLAFVDSDLYFVQDLNNFINPLLQVGSGGPKITGSGS